MAPASEPDRTRAALDEAADVLRTAVGRGRTAAADAIDRTVATFVRRRVDEAIIRAGDGPDPDEARLRRALDPRSPASSLVGGIRRATRLPVVRHTALARRLARRTPAGRLVGVVPIVLDALRANVTTVDAVADHLVARVIAAGHDPDPDAVAAVVVHALTNAADVTAPPDHGALLGRWATEYGRRLAPWGVRRLVPRSATADEVVAVADGVALAVLRA